MRYRLAQLVLVAALSYTQSASIVRAQQLEPVETENRVADWRSISAAMTGYERLWQSCARLAPARRETCLLDELNFAVARVFPRVTESFVPVLLPIDPSALMASGGGQPRKAVLDGAIEDGRSQFFQADSNGYDAAFRFKPSLVKGLEDLEFKGAMTVMMSGSSLVYKIGLADDASIMPAIELPDGIVVKLAHRAPDEYGLQYTFELFNSLYVLSLQCRRGPGVDITCNDAARVAKVVLRALRLAGGYPSPFGAQPEETTIPISRVSKNKISQKFSYCPPGALPKGTSYSEAGGVRSGLVFANIKFPLAGGFEAFVNSQVYNHGGYCDGNKENKKDPQTGSYECLGRVLTRNEFAPSPNYDYPWRDNFCESGGRSWPLQMCPKGPDGSRRGHQGEDVRGARCDGNGMNCVYAPVVASDNGHLIWKSGSEVVSLVVNRNDQRYIMRYHHMSPDEIATRVQFGKYVRAGDRLGTVANHMGGKGGTSYHLHFDILVPTRLGWKFVPPYSTLIVAYERAVGARGKQVACE